VSQIVERFGNARAARSKSALDRDAMVSADIRWYVENLKADLVQVEKSLSDARTDNETLRDALASAESRIKSLTEKVRQMEAGE
jgi:hypothetical protein